MPAGLNVYMDEGVLQLDSAMKTSVLVFKTTYAGPYYNDGNTVYIGVWYNFEVIIPGAAKYIFFSSSVKRVVALFKKSGTKYTFRTNVQGSLEIFGFADGAAVSAGKSGLQLFDENGVLTFDSDSQFMRISDAFLCGQDDNSLNGGVTRPWPKSGRKYAAGIGFYGKRWRGARNAGMAWAVLISYGIAVGPSDVWGGEPWIASRPWPGDAPPNDTPRHAAPTVLVVDVTDY